MIPKCRKWWFKDKLKEYHELKTKMIKFIIIDALREKPDLVNSKEETLAMIE